MGGLHGDNNLHGFSLAIEARPGPCRSSRRGDWNREAECSELISRPGARERGRTEAHGRRGMRPGWLPQKRPGVRCLRESRPTRRRSRAQTPIKQGNRPSTQKSRTRVFQGAVGAFCASTAPSASTGPVRVCDLSAGPGRHEGSLEPHRQNCDESGLQRSPPGPRRRHDLPDRGQPRYSCTDSEPFAYPVREDETAIKLASSGHFISWETRI